MSCTAGENLRVDRELLLLLEIEIGFLAHQSCSLATVSSELSLLFMMYRELEIKQKLQLYS